MAKSVRDAMTENPRSIGASASVVEAARLMRDEHIGSLPITDDEELVGMITDRDITTRVVAEAADPKMTSVGDVVSRDLISVEPDEELEEAVQLWPATRFGGCPWSRTAGSSASSPWRTWPSPLGRTSRGQASSSRRSPSRQEKSAGSVAQLRTRSRPTSTP